MKFKLPALLVSALVVGVAIKVPAAISDEPDGVSINVSEDGSFKIISIGTGTYDFNDPDDILDARKEAERNAKAAIAKFFKESLATEESASAMMSKMKKMSSDGESENVSVSKTTAKETMERIRSSSSALLTGVVVMEDEKVPSGNKGGSYRVMVGVSSKTIKGASSIANEMASVAGSGVVDGAAADGTVAATSAGGDVGNAPGASAPGLPPLPEGWTVCVGMGDERKAAVQAALIEGISQVYGQVLQNDERSVERMKKIKTQGSVLDQDIDATLKSKTKESVSATLTKTAGFIREYRIIQVVPKDGNQEATVYASIVNPRAGGTIALQVKKPTMSIADRTTIYQLGPTVRKSGAEVAVAVQFALPKGLARANKFLILNDESVKSVIENRVATEAMVATGLANASELMQVGQGLTPDMTLAAEIKDIKYTQKLGKDKKTKKYGKLYKMSAKLDVTLANARSGQIVKTDSITLSLDNDEIKGLLEEDEEADLLSALLAKLADSIEGWMAK